ncbi:hypothetical protein WG66_015766 [Moniliophthora roreri]|uniref:Uncharacterized protein n=1 Tax=Moniliophthora roreri TaxID=221103 RepID=A0A0W0FME0_MONRR|nr:hypothetical protein WG66_015766 [Moniliophthora roreri]
MNSSKSFFSPSLKRQQRIRAKRLAEILTPSKPDLQVIIEDAEETEEPRPSCSSWTTASSHGRMTPELKKRKATKLSDIRVPRDATCYVPHEDEDILEINSSLLSAPRPAPRPPTSSSLSSSGSRSPSPCRTTSPSPNPSPDSFRLTFGDKSTFKFPHPPLPTPSSSNRHFASPYSSPSSESTGLPSTPGSSDSSDDDELPHHTTLRRLKSIRPLTIVKRDASHPNSGYISASPSKSDVGDDSLEFKNFFANSPAPSSTYSPANSQMSFLTSPVHDIFSPRIRHEELQSDEDDLSDSEWYTKELSTLLTLRSAIPQSLIHHTIQNRPESVYARPESEYIHIPASPSPPSGTRGSRLSKPLPKLPSAQLDPGYAYVERRRSFLIPSRPPPPPPTKSKESRPRPPSLALRRPPPRSSIPADFFMEDGTDADSTLSLVDFYTSSPTTMSAPSNYSQASAEAEADFLLYSPPAQESESSPASSANSLFEFDFEVEVDAPMMLPLSLPGIPLMDTDFLDAVGEEEHDEALDIPFKGPSVPLPPVPETEGTVVHDSPIRQPTPPPQPQLRSRWSSSTLSSVHEEHRFAGLRSPLSSKFRFFGTPRKSLDAKAKPTPKKPVSSKKQRSVVVVGPTMFSPVSPGPMSPTSPYTPPKTRRTHAHSYASPRGYDSPSSFSFSSSSESPMSPTSPSPKYPSPRAGGHVRRRPSTSTVSSSSACSSCESELSIGSGLRRKPIPVEMFLRASTA